MQTKIASFGSGSVNICNNGQSKRILFINQLITTSDDDLDIQWYRFCCSILKILIKCADNHYSFQTPQRVAMTGVPPLHHGVDLQEMLSNISVQQNSSIFQYSTESLDSLFAINKVAYLTHLFLKTNLFWDQWSYSTATNPQ